MSPATFPPVDELHDVDADRFEAEVAAGYRPVVLRGLVRDWPAVAAGRQSPRAMADYIARFDGGRPSKVMIGAPAIGGRFFYRDDMRGFNFQQEQASLRALLDKIIEGIGDPKAPALYAGAAAAAEHLPGWTAANPLPLPTPDAIPRVWIGTATRVSTHYDVSSNVACVVAGRRRFTLFPPEQLTNLYVGPLDVTIAGQPTSMVDLENPDLDRYPRFAEALAHARVADLEPGDAIYVPSMWWHNVRAFDPINVLVNYWWGDAGPESPFPALIHALVAVRDLPPGERAAVRAWFDHYVFGEDATRVADHLPEHARGVLGAPSPERSARILGYLIRSLSRGAMPSEPGKNRPA